MEPPELWWSPSLADGQPFSLVWRSPADGSLWRLTGARSTRYVNARLDELPDDAVPLAPAEPVDDKGRGESYWRGVSDGRLDERARRGRLRRVANDHLSPDAPDGHPLWARPDFGVRAVTDHVPFSDGLLPVRPAHDEPPFAPELADAPLVTGQFGSPAPMVVDHPVHDSTLPVELGRGPLRDFPSSRPEDEGTHYFGDGCEPPHPGRGEGEDHQR